MALVRPTAADKAVAELTREHVLIPWEAQGGAPPIAIDHAKGCWLYTPAGRDARASLPRGTYLMARYNVFLVTPPRIVTEEEIEEGVRAIDGALADVRA